MIDLNELTIEQLTLLEEQLKQKMTLPICPCCKKRCGNYILSQRPLKALRTTLLEILKELPKGTEFSTGSLQQEVTKRGNYLSGSLRNRISSEITKFNRMGIIECLTSLRGSHIRLYRYIGVK